jgi:hypothetical protein
MYTNNSLKKSLELGYSNGTHTAVRSVPNSRITASQIPPPQPQSLRAEAQSPPPPPPPPPPSLNDEAPRTLSPPVPHVLSNKPPSSLCNIGREASPPLQYHPPSPTQYTPSSAATTACRSSSGNCSALAHQMLHRVLLHAASAVCHKPGHFYGTRAQTPRASRYKGGASPGFKRIRCCN